MNVSADRGSSTADVNAAAVFRIAWPIILANASVPLLGIVDTAVIGNLGSAHYLGAVAVGAALFSFLYWAFGFLRMSTTALTAQSVGAGQSSETTNHLLRASVIGAGAGLSLILLQWPIAAVGFPLFGPSDAVRPFAETYFAIRIWGAPAAFITTACLGWFIGLERTRYVLAIQLFLNGLNIVLDILFVVGLGWAVAGVATATLISEWSAAAVALWLVWRTLPQKSGLFGTARRSEVFDPKKLRSTIFVNANIMIRSLCLMFAFAWFTAQGARMGDIVLAANAVLLQFFHITAYLIDGFAMAAETLVGKMVGASDRFKLRRAVVISTYWAAAIATALSLLILVVGPLAIDGLTNVQEVRESARNYLYWSALIPIIAIWCFQLDGIFIGATQTVDMRNMMILSLAAYLLCWPVLTTQFGNHGHWAAFLFFFAMRGITLAVLYPKLERGVEVLATK